MTERKINYALKKIEECRKARHNYEAFILLYQLNAGLIRYLIVSIAADESTKGKKLRSLVKSLQSKIESDPELSSLIQKRSIKSLKPWLEKCESVFKQLRSGEETKLASLIQESEKIFGILKISVNKLNSKISPAN